MLYCQLRFSQILHQLRGCHFIMQMDNEVKQSKSYPGAFQGNEWHALSLLAKSVTWSQWNRACISFIRDKTEGRKIKHKHEADDGSCCRGLESISRKARQRVLLFIGSRIQVVIHHKCLSKLKFVKMVVHWVFRFKFRMAVVQKTCSCIYESVLINPRH